MTFVKAFFLLNKTTFLNLFQKLGIIFSGILFFVCLVMLFAESWQHPIQFFIGSIVIGNGLALFCSISSLLQSCKVSVKILKLNEQISDDEIQKFELKVVTKENLTNDYKEFSLYSCKNNILFSYYNKRFFVTRIIEYQKSLDFLRVQKIIEKKYRKESISLNGWGIFKPVSLKKCTDTFVEDIVEQFNMIKEEFDL